MANDLVRWRVSSDHGEQSANEIDTQDDNEQWDAPPDRPKRHSSSFNASRQQKEGSAAQIADKDAAQAQRLGDSELAFTRDEDAAEHRQKRLDWGNFQTWAILGGMCLAFLLVCAFAYIMPQGRHNQSDLPNPTPPGRFY